MSDNNTDKKMSLREHYAGLAMQGMLANFAGEVRNADFLCKEAVEYADLLIAELSKQANS
ncbi:hypothetical protein [Psychrobacter sp. K31L]|uniref:hypothetical protein n=1 Tax=Psychrobacter sp. K31L TaxID=2820758 RepID=UPI001B332B4F|nr:hypothetical protein [Psychrobacter sp. K31L]MBP3945149.1 hypothetical protein [Psychrobacter sp. K31L]